MGSSKAVGVPLLPRDPHYTVREEGPFAKILLRNCSYLCSFPVTTLVCPGVFCPRSPRARDPFSISGPTSSGMLLSGCVRTQSPRHPLRSSRVRRKYLAGLFCNMAGCFDFSWIFRQTGGVASVGRGIGNFDRVPTRGVHITGSGPNPRTPQRLGFLIPELCQHLRCGPRIRRSLPVNVGRFMFNVRSLKKYSSVVDRTTCRRVYPPRQLTHGLNICGAGRASAL